MANIGDAIKKSVAESFKSMDPVGLMRTMVSETPEDEEGLQIKEKLEGILKKYEEMSEEDRESFVGQMKEMLASKISAKLSDTNINMDGLQEAIGQAVMQRLIFLGVGVLIFVILLVFFGWKLYKSIKEKEIKREEKKKQKQMKKKK
ncbi:hypothetical protein O0L34_g13465 [Tuta absoluta]|nr:hypothetical protein O0L34_g13465 [Tuta absoluta]